LKKKTKNVDRAASPFILWLGPTAWPIHALAPVPARACSLACVTRSRGPATRVGPATRPTRALACSLSLTAWPRLSSPSFALAFSPMAMARWPAGDHDNGHPTNRSNTIYSSPRTSPDHSRDHKRPRGNTSPAMAARCSRLMASRRSTTVASKLKAR
jgi:hypothetical protein